MAGCWPRSFCACLWSETGGVEVHKFAKENEVNIQPSCPKGAGHERIYDMAFGKFFSLGTQRVAPSGQDRAIDPVRVANHSAVFGSSCPLTELSK